MSVHFSSFAPSCVGAAPQADAAAPHSMCTEQPCCQYHNALLAPHFFPVGQSHVCAQQRPTVSAAYGQGSPMSGYHNVLLALHSLQCPVSSLDQSPGRGPLHARCGALLFLLELDLGRLAGPGVCCSSPAVCPRTRETRQWRSPVPLVLEHCISSQRALACPQSSLYSLNLLCRSCSTGPQVFSQEELL